MRVTGVSYCDFMVWTPSEFIVLRIEPDISFMESVFNKCDVFWNRFILRELVTREVESGMKLPSSTLTETINNDDNVFCICKSKSLENDDTMVGCDSCDNWFHLKCISLKSVPRSSVWYCNSCKNKKKSAHKNKPIH
nr:chromatin modification-related protein png1-like [Hydra vulgaris]